MKGCELRRYHPVVNQRESAASREAAFRTHSSYSTGQVSRAQGRHSFLLLSAQVWPCVVTVLPEFRLRAGAVRFVPPRVSSYLSRYLLKTPDKWLNSAQGSNAKRKIEEALAAKLAAGELTGFEDVREDENGTDRGGLLAEGGGGEEEKERQAS